MFELRKIDFGNKKIEMNNFISLNDTGIVCKLSIPLKQYLNKKIYFSISTRTILKCKKIKFQITISCFK